MTASHQPLQTWANQLETKPMEQKEMALKGVANRGMISKEEVVNSSSFLRTQCRPVVTGKIPADLKMCPTHSWAQLDVNADTIIICYMTAIKKVYYVTLKYDLSYSTFLSCQVHLEVT